MELYDNIFKRKSTRKYHMQPLEDLSLIQGFMQEVKPLYNDISTRFELQDSVKGMWALTAPHYMLAYSEQKEGYLENIGFMLQQLDLYLSARGLGSCWLGMAKPAERSEGDKTYVIMLAFGKTDSAHRQLSEFLRKPASEVYSGEDSRLEAARLAPSATNSQNWFFEAKDGKIDVYQKKLNPAKALVLDKMNRIDMGIALCHLYLATQREGKEFSFSKQPGKEKKGFMYVGTVD